MADITITIKNVPDEPTALVWEDIVEYAYKEYKDIVEPVNVIAIDYNKCSDFDNIFNLLATAITEHVMQNSINAKAEA